MFGPGSGDAPDAPAGVTHHGYPSRLLKNSPWRHQNGISSSPSKITHQRNQMVKKVARPGLGMKNSFSAAC